MAMRGAKMQSAPFRVHRRGFSLVEMLVVLAIMLLVMSILAMAYDAAMRSMRLARGLQQISVTDLGNFEKQLRFLLRQRHFEGDLRVSQINPNDPNTQPTEGFFAVIEGNTSGTEIDTDDGLNFTVRLIGNGPGDFFETSLIPPSNWSPPAPLREMLNPFQPPAIQSSPLGFPESRYQPITQPIHQTYRSQWAEIAVFLTRQPDPEDPTKRAATVPLDHPAHPDNVPPPNPSAARLYRLHLRRLLLRPSHFAKGQADFDLSGRIVVHQFQPPQSNPPYYYPEAYDLSVHREQPGAEEWVLNSAADLKANPAYRFYNPSFYGPPRPWEPNELPNDWSPGWPGPLSSRSFRQGWDIVLNNVISFDVKRILPGGAVGDGNYDSTSNQPISGIWIRIRVFDPKTQQLRDLVIVEAL
jgi:prepilin-type N-terminal cleavage/methylation domain-containing protein